MKYMQKNVWFQFFFQERNSGDPPVNQGETLGDMIWNKHKNYFEKMSKKY